MPDTFTTSRLSPTDWISTVRKPDGYVCLRFPELDVEIPPELAASLFAGIVQVMTPSAKVVPFPFRSEERGIAKLFDGSSELIPTRAGVELPADSEGT